MYISNLQCGWLSHPFSRNQFKIESDKDIAKIVAVGVATIEINTNKGLDVLVKKTIREEIPLKHEPETIEIDTNQAMELPVNETVAEPSVELDTAEDEPIPQHVSVAEEMGKAEVAFAQAGEFITEMMANVKMGQHIELEQVNPVINKLSQSILRNSNALLGLSRIRDMDAYTFQHSVSFSVLMMAFAKSMGLSETIICEVGIGGLLHDIGKTLIPNEILNKPGKLTDEEFTIMKKHVVYSREILEKTPGISQVSMDVAAQHHEKYDGNGYPLGLKGDQISRYGQMAAIVDVYDALTADRCYHVGKDPSEVLRLLLKWSGTHFNPALVREFIHSVGIYPPSSLVRLNTQHIAKVIDINENMLKPVVEVFYYLKTNTYIPRKLIDLSKIEKIKILNVESHSRWNAEA